MKYLTMVVLGCIFFADSTLAAVTAEVAARLGKDLTPVGAEMAGNSSGTIPAWTGGLDKNAGKILGNNFLEDPYSKESPLFTITRDNVEQYKDHLTEGQLALFRRYSTFAMPVYPSHRSAKLPESLYEAARYNAEHTELVEDGNGLQGFHQATPFPIPDNALEVVWNHLTRYRGGSAKRTHVQATPLADGSFIPVSFRQEFAFQSAMPGYDENKGDDILFYYKQLITGPARLAGDIVLVHEPINQVKNPRMAWIYNAGQRRVRRAPQIAYDGPYPASDGQRVADNLDMFNGAVDRYDWKLIGKREIYIPYNSYKLESPDAKYKDIIQAGHLNPEYTRYELHRVWVVDATVKNGQRHVYGRRTFYIDEDSWQISIADHYDNRGELWRVGMGHIVQLYHVDVPWLGVEVLHDLINGRYLVSGMRNEESNSLTFGTDPTTSEYTPAALRSSGVR
ncbi:DUF1329 domain-containing protein [Thalassolituus sp. LLYu03]|uniref:DUF1329 domain-containing protein n=1 Tax=Thalassolituus sp. LLYu03 TaxID=3421656 RepID=UPI003D2AF364